MENSLEKFKNAVQEGRAADVRTLLGQHPELREWVDSPWGPFDTQPVVLARSQKMLEVLLEAGADINSRSKWWAGGFGLLDFAAPELAEYAISRGAVVDAHAAARLGKGDRLRELLAGDAALVHARGGDGQTPLHFAASIEIATLLLEHGADVNARDVDHESTPAQYMARDRQDVARFLLTRGAESDLLLAAALGDLDRVRQFLGSNPDHIRMKVSDRWFPKRDPRSGGCIYNWTLGANKDAPGLAREFGHTAVFEWLWSRTPDSQKLVIAARNQDREAVEELLAAHGPDVFQSLGKDELESLVSAAESNAADAVNYMLSIGWPADVRESSGATALHWASFHGNTAMVEGLLARNPPLDLPDRHFHSTPLGWAIHGSEHGWHRQTGDYAAVVRSLLAAGAKLPENAGENGSPPVRALLKDWGRV